MGKRKSLPVFGRTKRVKLSALRGRRRRRKGKRSSNASYTSRQLNASNGFKMQARKVSKSAWRRKLWNATDMMQHFRSIFLFTNNPATPAGVTGINLNLISAFSEVDATTFWKSAAGAQDPSFGQRPTWMNPPGAGVPEPINIVIRGGRIWATVANPSTTDTINVRIQLAFPKQQLMNTTDTATGTTIDPYITAIVGGNPRPWSWDMQSAPDYQEYFYAPVMDKTFDLKPGDDAMFMHKVKVNKIDTAAFKRGAGYFPWWIIYTGQRVDTTAGAQAVTLQTGHNISFAVLDTLDT